MKFQNQDSIIDLFTRICQKSEYAYILESVEGPEKLAEYSFIGFDPKIIVTVKNGVAEIRNQVENERLKLSVDDPLDLIEELVGQPYASPVNCRLIGGAIGYVSYDAIRYWERLPEIAEDDLD
ncbi:hypothetical protein H5T51_07960, partial [Candidatus Bathyarchaeota archaeon]|nr:hypothetical protein [Candidatus Bathyarchaeota archaeon]